MKKFTSCIVIVFLFLGISSNVFAQADGDYRSAIAGGGFGMGGTWTAAGTWERYNGTLLAWEPAVTYPTSANANVITIRSTDSVYLTTVGISIDQVVVESGASFLIYSSTSTLANNPVGSAIDVNGSFYIASGGTLSGAGTIRVNSGGFMQIRNSGLLAVNTVVDGILQFNATANIGSVQTVTVTNNGTIDWLTGDIFISNSSSLINNGTFLIKPAATTQISGASPSSLTNSSTGVFEKSTTSTTVIAIPFTNAGIIHGVGDYQINNSVTNTGTVAPGISTGTGILTTTPNQSNVNNLLTATTNLQIQILTSLTPGTGHDQFIINNTGTMTGITPLTGTLTIVDNPGVAPLGVYTILSATEDITGTFTTVVKPSNFGDPVYDYANDIVTIEKLMLSPLPVVWGNFTAASKNGAVYLNWNTLSESNTSHFDVEFSTDNRNFSTVATVTAKGNSSAESFYSHVHSVAGNSGTMYYRLKQIDIDGKFTYSDTKIVRNGESNSLVLTLAPNPVGNNGTLVTVLANNLSLRLTDLNGRVIQTWKLNQGNHRIYLNDVPSGNYILTGMENNKVVHSQKLIKQ